MALVEIQKLEFRTLLSSSQFFSSLTTCAPCLPLPSPTFFTPCPLLSPGSSVKINAKLSFEDNRGHVLHTLPLDRPEGKRASRVREMACLYLPLSLSTSLPPPIVHPTLISNRHPHAHRRPNPNPLLHPPAALLLIFLFSVPPCLGHHLLLLSPLPFLPDPLTSS